MALTTDIKGQFSHSLANIGEIVEGVKEIEQALTVILTTSKGSDPGRPDFGVDLISFIGGKTDQVLAKIRREILAQIELWEPRVEITSVNLEVEEAGKITLKIGWIPTGSPSIVQQLILSYG